MIETIFIVLSIIAYFANGISKNMTIRFASLFWLASMVLIGWSLFYKIKDQPIIIQKSSDSDWEFSTNYEIKSDTCITNIKIINNTDTVYPTTCYKILKK